jgi:hypothetical protein
MIATRIEGLALKSPMATVGTVKFNISEDRQSRYNVTLRAVER